MQRIQRHLGVQAQTAVEYLLIFTVVAIAVFVGFKTLLPRTHTVSEDFFNRVSNGIMGDPPPVTF